MHYSAHTYGDSRNAKYAGIATSDLPRLAAGWLTIGDVNGWSERTIATRKALLAKVSWFLRQREIEFFDKPAVLQFLAYTRVGHKDPGGRWGNPRCTAPIRPATVATYYANLHAFFRWLEREELIETSPMAKIDPPISRRDAVQPLTPEQARALLKAAQRGRHARRDEAILLFLLDTGVRASELCGLRLSDLDLAGRTARVLGKGNKSRPVGFSGSTAKALWQYLLRDPRQESDPVFLSERGGPMDRSSLRQMICRVSKAAGVKAHPHLFRHTYSVEFLRAGGNQFSLMASLGHTTTTMTSRYVSLAEADVQRAMRQFSPVERLKGGKR